MPERRADELKKGDVVTLRGEPWMVLKAKQRGKHVHLTIDGRQGTFSDDVKARTVYQVAEPAKSPEKALHGPSGEQRRWATAAEDRRDLVAPADGGPVKGWGVADKADRKLIDGLGARLVGVEVEGGKLVVPEVTDATILGHLVLLHGVRYDGVSLAEAKAWAKANDPGGPATAAETMSALTLQRAHEIHADLHANLAGMVKPHWHREGMPK